MPVPTTETIDRLFLELSQFTTARTRREIDVSDLLRDALAENAALKATITALEAEKLIREAVIEGLKAREAAK